MITCREKSFLNIPVPCLGVDCRFLLQDNSSAEKVAQIGKVGDLYREAPVSHAVRLMLDFSSPSLAMRMEEQSKK